MGSISQIILQLIYLLPILLLSLSFHEFSHGLASYKLGDPTPKNAGRLTLNPLPHLDPVGTLVLIVTRRIGWAKPVPVNPRYYDNPRQGLMLVGLAGPTANFILAFLFSLLTKPVIFRFVGSIGLGESTATFLSLAIQINLALAIFNLLPVPPLDGSKILRGFLPTKFDKYLNKLEGPAGMIILMVLAFTGYLGKIIFPVVRLLYNFLVY